jgi:hypothetical protein
MWIVGYILSLQCVDINPKYRSEISSVLGFYGIRSYFQ